MKSPDIGKAFKKIRLFRAKTQEDFGSISSRTHISRLENNQRGITVERMHILMNELDIHSITLIALAYAHNDPEKAIGLLHKSIEEIKIITMSDSIPQ